MGMGHYGRSLASLTQGPSLGLFDVAQGLTLGLFGLAQVPSLFDLSLGTSSISDPGTSLVCKSLPFCFMSDRQGLYTAHCAFVEILHDVRNSSVPV